MENNKKKLFNSKSIQRQGYHKSLDKLGALTSLSSNKAHTKLLHKISSSSYKKKLSQTFFFKESVGNWSSSKKNKSMKNSIYLDESGSKLKSHDSNIASFLNKKIILPKKNSVRDNEFLNEIFNFLKEIVEVFKPKTSRPSLAYKQIINNITSMSVSTFKQKMPELKKEQFNINKLKNQIDKISSKQAYEKKGNFSIEKFKLLLGETKHFLGTTFSSQNKKIDLLNSELTSLKNELNQIAKNKPELIKIQPVLNRLEMERKEYFLELKKQQKLVKNIQKQVNLDESSQKKCGELQSTLLTQKNYYENELLFLKSKLGKKDVFYSKFLHLISEIKEKQEKDSKHIKNSEKTIKQLTHDLTFYKKESSHFIKNMNRWRERAMMLLEDKEGQMRRIEDLEMLILKLHEKMGGLNFSNTDAENEKDISVQDLLRNGLQEIDTMLKEETLCYRFCYIGKKDNIAFNSIDKLAEYANLAYRVKMTTFAGNEVESELVPNWIIRETNLKEFDLTFTLNRKMQPSVVHLVHLKALKKSKEELRQLFSEQFSIFKILGVIRALFDSYWIELQTNPFETCLPFGQFVYVWFHRFSFDFKQKRIVKNDLTTLEIESSLIKFLIQLTSPLFKKLWDSSLFLEFLCGKYSKDEIFYYLYLRFSLRGGREVEIGDVSTELYTYLDFDELKLILSKFLGKFIYKF